MTGSSPAAATPIESIILPELQRAQSIAVIPCAVPFSSKLNHRPCSLARYFADQGSTVLFVEVWQSPEDRVHAAGEEVYPKVFTIPFYAFDDGIQHTFLDNLEAIRSASYAKRSYICTLPLAALVEAAGPLRAAGYHIHYDIMDDWEEFQRDGEEHWFSPAVERQMVAIADTVSAISEKLARKFRALRSDILVVQNGYEPAALGCEQFSSARAPLECPKTAGYFGHLSDAWFDWETVFCAAHELPDVQFELIGYGLSETTRAKANGVPNIRLPGLVPQSCLHHHVSRWWIGMIPFRATPLSAAVDPLKIYEYLHFGLPTAVTGICGIASYPLVQYASDRESFISAIERVKDRPDEQSLARTAEFLKGCLWEERLAKLNGRIHSVWQLRQFSVAGRTEERLRELHQAFEVLTGRNEMLSRELGRATALLESKEAEIRKSAERESGLVSELQHWRGRAAELEKDMERRVEAENGLRGERLRLQQEIARLSAAVDQYTAENQTLTSRAAASSYETANLRRSLAEVWHSRSWRITAPLRFVSRPLFAALAAKTSAPPGNGTTAHPLGPAAVWALASNPLDSVVSELRRARSVTIIPCAVPFSSTLNQRPISCARYLADQGSTILYVSWQWSPDEEVPRAFQEVYPKVFEIPLYAFQENIHSIASASHAKSAYLCTLPSPGLVDVVLPLRAAGFHIHYDIMDDWAEFHRGGEAPWFLEAVEREMVILADTVTAVSPKLAEKFESCRGDIKVVRNGYDPAALGCPQFIAAHTHLEQPRTIGYFGHFSDAWFDWDSVFHAAEKLPEMRFELIGYGLSEKSRVRLDAYGNVRFLGLVPQRDLHQYARRWWGGMIPFRPSELAAAVDPLKIYEYLHLGLPTVVTGISGIAGYPLVSFAGDREAFVAALDSLARRPDEKTLSEVNDFLKACVWNERLAELWRAVDQDTGLASLYAR